MPEPSEDISGHFVDATSCHTGLRDGNEIEAFANGGDGVALDRGRSLVAAELDIAEHDWVKAGILEGLDGDNGLVTALANFDGINPASS